MMVIDSITSFLFLLAGFLLISGSLADILKYDLRYITPLTVPKVVHTVNRTTLLLDLFKDNQNVIILDEDKSVIIHSTVLNTASNNAKNTIFELSPSFKSQGLDEWYEIYSELVLMYLGPSRPLTSCLSLKYGDGGVLSASFNKMFGSVQIMDWAYGFSFLSNFGAGISYEGNFGESFVISGSFDCPIKANQTGQVFVQPYYVEYENPQVRQIVAEKSATWFNPFVKSVNKLSYKSWESVGTIKMVSSLSRPIITCTTDEQTLRCDEEIEGSTWNM